jgi:hypothetical protein
VFVELAVLIPGGLLAIVGAITLLCLGVNIFDDN